MDGYAGAVLRVDLGRSTVWKEPLLVTSAMP
jgi:hypothetical protein